ncbi:hypothetical protein LJC26_06965 [Desulfovibrio sp. OttesenSCG-928-O18]|nr:hypothetical protein [Desulfovibrio sp. OttesenSCG-928-O18]
MATTLRYRMIPEGESGGIHIPLTIIFLDIKDVRSAGLEPAEAIRRIAKQYDGPAGFTVFDLDCVTTTSDGIMVEGAIVVMGASDRGRVNPDFGILEMAEIPFSPDLVEAEPHLAQWEKLYPGKRLFRGPDPKKKIIPVHNVCITGRASNNNSATEMMHIVTMEEILLPILGQIEIMKNGSVVLGKTGEVISVGIGMTVAEEFGRVFPTRQFRAGETAHGSGEYAKTLKKNIPCIVADKSVFARHIIRTLDCGMVPGREIGCSPAVLAVARALGREVAVDNISPAAWEELASVGITREWLAAAPAPLSAEEVVAKAAEIIPGVEHGRVMRAETFVRMETLDS